MGQANAARDKLYDLRECNLAGSKAEGFDLSGVIMSKTDLSKATFKESQFSKGYMHGKRGFLLIDFACRVFSLMDASSLTINLIPDPSRQ